MINNLLSRRSVLNQVLNPCLPSSVPCSHMHTLTNTHSQPSSVSCSHMHILTNTQSAQLSTLFTHTHTHTHKHTQPAQLSTLFTHAHPQPSSVPCLFTHTYSLKHTQSDITYFFKVIEGQEYIIEAWPAIPVLILEQISIFKNHI